MFRFLEYFQVETTKWERLTGAEGLNTTNATDQKFSGQTKLFETMR